MHFPHYTIIFERLGPYHLSRLNALGKRVQLSAVEIVRKDTTYEWDLVNSRCNFERVTLFPDEHYGRNALQFRISEALNRLKPQIVALPSWGTPAAWAAFQWALRCRTAIVIMTASQYCDRPRKKWKEFLKRQLVTSCGAAFVGGQRQMDYVKRLGMPESRIFTGYDTVDNNHFASGAEEARNNASRVRVKLNLPGRYFLTSSRFIPKKNIFGLLESYKLFRQCSHADDWKLVILGDGPLRADIEKRIAALDLKSHVFLPGFKQYGELPSYYGLASAFVLASSMEQWGLVVNEAMAAGLPVLVSKACGCLPRLVRKGVNGFGFDCGDPHIQIGRAS